MTSPTGAASRGGRWRPVRIVSENLGIYLAMNAASYALFLVGFAVGLVWPRLALAQQTRLVDDGTADLVGSLINSPWLFALTILAVNLIKMGVLTIVLPSMIVPFAGIALFAYWAFTTGVTLVPASGIGWVALIPHSITVVVEFQAYILLLLGAFLLGKNWIRPRAAGSETRRGGYIRGLEQLGRLASAAALLLIVGAIYEAFSLRYLVHPLAQWML
jgi:hypothetical protein